MFKRTRAGLWTLVVLALALGVLSAPPALAQPQPPSALPLAMEAEEICAVNEFDILGQGHAYIQGASGTLPPGVSPDQIIDPASPALHVVREIGVQTVAILVVDDFTGVPNETPHGRMVTDLLIKMIQANPIYAAPPQLMNDDPVVWRWTPSGYGTLLVVEVDTEGYDTSLLRTRVEEAARLMVNKFGVRRMVMNMSFVLVPCVTPDYDLFAMREMAQKGERVTLLEAVARARQVPLEFERTPEQALKLSLMEDPALQAVSRVLVGYAQQVATDTTRGGALDPLHEFIQDFTGTGQYWNPTNDIVLFAVGSAGNFGRSLDAFVPAAWTEVAATSAFLGARDPWAGSNRGQVMLAGGLYPYGNSYLLGTSFAAPVLTMNMAFYLTRSELCPDPPVMLDLYSFPDSPFLRTINPKCIAGRR